jgi:hypothetical protein
MNILFPRTKNSTWPTASVFSTLQGQILINGSVKQAAIPIVNDGVTPNWRNFGPARVITQSIVTNSDPSPTFYYTTSREIGPGLFNTLPPTPDKLFPSVPGVLAGAFLDANKDLFIGSLAAKKSFDNPGLASNFSAVGALAGQISANTHILGFKTLPQDVDPLTFSSTSQYSTRLSVYLGATSGTGIFPDGTTFPVNQNTAVGYGSLSLPDVTPTINTWHAANCTAIGYNTLRGLNKDPKMVAIGSNTLSSAYKRANKFDIEGLLGAALCIGANTFNKALPVDVFSGGTNYGIDATTVVGSRIASNREAKLIYMTMINNSGVELDQLSFVNACNIGIPGAPLSLTTGSRTGNTASSFSFQLGPIKYDSWFGLSLSVYRVDAYADSQNSAIFLPPSTGEDSYGRGPLVSQGLDKPFISANGVNRRGYGATGSFRHLGKIYTVKNGLITSVA